MKLFPQPLPFSFWFDPDPVLVAVPDSGPSGIGSGIGNDTRPVGRLARVLIAVVIALWFNGAATAAADVILRTSVDPEEAWVGQRVKLDIEVLGADGWAQIPKLPEPEIAGAYVMRTESQGVRISESVGRTSYTGQRYQLSVYCQRAGRLEIPAMPVTVSIKQWGATPPETLHELENPSTVLVCETPPGAEGIRGLISTTRLEAAQQWSSRPDTLAPGDALTRTVTLSAVDVSAMAFPPMQHPEIEGVATYPGQPSVADETDRGSLRGQREESVTYVFEKPGEVVLPTIVLSWWNIRAERLERIELPGLEIEVVGEVEAEAADAEALSEPPSRQRDLTRTILLIVPIAAFGLWSSAWLVRRLRSWWAARRESEPAHFRRVQAAIRGGDPRVITAAVMRWLDRLDPGARPARLDLFLRRHGDDATRSAAASLARSLATGESLSDRGAFARGLTKTRRRFLRSRRHRQHAAGVLPELNEKSRSE